MNKNTLLSLIAGVVVVAGGVWIYKSNTASVVAPNDTKQVVDTDEGDDATAGTTNPPSNTPPAGQKMPGSGIVDASGVKNFTVKGTSFSFAPSIITVKKGDKIRITLDNTGGFHDLKIDEFNVATKKIQTGQQDAIEFTADKTGSFEYYCSVGEHRQMGMKGTLIVE